MSERRSGVANRWLVGRRSLHPTAIDLYCFPHSGGSAGEFLRWGERLPDVQLMGINPPGRGSRLEEPPVTEMRRLVAAILDEVTFTEPFAFFGHSLGGLVAYEVARELRERGRERPELLVLSATPAAHADFARRPPLHRMPDEELLAELDRRYGGLPPQVHTDPELAALILPAYRADLTVLETYRHEPGPPLDVPFHVFGGDQDVVSAGELGEWRRHTTESRVRLFPGGHFYFRDDVEGPLAALAELLAGGSRTGPGGRRS